MKHASAIVPLVLAVAVVAAAQEQRVLPPIQVYFSPHGGCTQAIVQELGAARSTVLVQAYSFTSATIARALVDARNRGVSIAVILDKSQRTEKYSEADFLVNMGIPTRIDAAHAIAHNKIMVIDGQVVITGSFNFTKAAEESNAENLLVIWDRGLADKYTENWNLHAAHSEMYGARTEPYRPPVSSGPTSITPPAQVGYVASARSEVFHRAGCRFAATISPGNLVKYAARDEAIRAGKRPCAECKP